MRSGRPAAGSPTTHISGTSSTYTTQRRPSGCPSRRSDTKPARSNGRTEGANEHTGQQILEAAKAELGVQEHPPGSNRGQRVEFFQTFDWLAGGGYAWCVDF